ncbi:hypothetical protein UY3_14807 [Chelonia mydas]|uniref:Uncharacterized protein n=1 Tax=Chelonia mydas TaxID=8469 RepID=M7AS29_CHEMY|nr:hypothetical protein UY3_14807 [Chelonia mydas]
MDFRYQQKADDTQLLRSFTWAVIQLSERQADITICLRRPGGTSMNYKEGNKYALRLHSKIMRNEQNTLKRRYG